ncbi:type VI secretion system Vgr family protein [Pseudomonas sp. Sample_16]|uniref:type VI secretion system Vgr family protein n=1 Tax=Pseudomonas sp. Sample_16 TaxID=2448263 RepID=UPI001032A1D3|nr:type VI secretion system Vgr family protein [Pseudomonas sp. Sample_16]
MNSISDTAMSSFGHPLSQAERLLQLTTPQGQELFALRAHGQERMGRVPRYTVDVINQAAAFDPELLIGQAVQLGIKLDDGSYSPRHGWVESVRYLGSDGGLDDWQLVFAPWFSLLEYRVDCRIWQEMSLPDIFAQVFQHYSQARGAYRFELSREYPLLSYVTQFNETDAHFVQRWCEQEGLFWYVQHEVDSHCIVFTDSLMFLPTLTPATLRFHTQQAADLQDSITQWSPGARLLNGAVQASSNDYFCHARSQVTRTVALPAASAPPDLERYQYRGQYAWQNPDRGDWLSRVQIEQDESAARRIQGQGGVRQMQPGHGFELAQHPLYELKTIKERQFLIIAVEFFAQSNLPVGMQRISPPGSLNALFESEQRQSMYAVKSEGFYLNRFETQRLDIAYRSPFAHAKPASPGPQTAVVVAPSGREVFTDSLNRICVRFHWDRLVKDGELGSCWLRMMQASSGQEWGSVNVPRSGEEVVITFLDNDIDRPLVMGQVYGGHKPAWHSSGLMSGYKSREIQGRGYNQWVMDDSTGQVRTQIHSSHGHSQLNLGYLIDQQGNQRGGLRGTGFELRTDAYGALRAQQGLYLSTWPRNNAQGGQVDVREARLQLTNAQERVRALSEAAQQHNALPMQGGVDSLEQLTADTQLNYGSDDNSVSSAKRQTRNAGDTDAAISSGGRGQTPGYHKPLLIASAPADIATATPQNTHLHSGKQLTLSTGEDINLASGKSLLASVAEGISLFAQAAGAKLFAAKGKIEIQAQSDCIELTARDSVRITSTARTVEIAAQEEILLTSGGAYIRIKDGNIEIHAPGTVDVKGVKKTFSGPAQLNRDNPAWPTASLRQTLTLMVGQSSVAGYQPWAGMPYKVFADGAPAGNGVMDASGQIAVDHHATTSRYRIELANGVKYNVPVAGDYTDDPDNAERANQGFQRHSSQPHPEITPPDDASQFRQAYTQLNSPKPEA